MSGDAPRTGERARRAGERARNAGALRARRPGAVIRGRDSSFPASPGPGGARDRLPLLLRHHQPARRVGPLRDVRIAQRGRASLRAAHFPPPDRACRFARQTLRLGDFLPGHHVAQQRTHLVRILISLRRREVEPRVRLHVVLRHALALGLRIPLLGSPKEFHAAPLPHSKWTHGAFDRRGHGTRMQRFIPGACLSVPYTLTAMTTAGVRKSDSASLLAQSLRESPAVRAAIDTLVREVQAAGANLTGERPARPELKDRYEELLARAAAVRGRDLLYPALGSGLGRGALVELADGSVKWDMICGIGVHFFGHSDPELIRAAAESAIDDVVKHGNLTSNFDAYSFAETLTREAARETRLAHCYLSTSGAMANENALKVCFQKHAPASRVIAFDDCFMGRTWTMSQIGDTAEYRQHLPLNTLVDYMPFWDPVAAESAGGKSRFIDGAVRRLQRLIDRYPGQHACFIFELIQGEGGFNVGDRDFFKALMDLCKASSIAVWIDEIQTFGRTTRMFAYELFDLGKYVDVLTVGKMTQACATLFTPDYNPKPGLLSGTFLGEGISFRVGRRVVERLRDGRWYGDDGAFARHHAAFRDHARALISRHPEWFPPVPELGGGGDCLIGGVGGMMRLTPFGGRRRKITEACRTIFDEGVILFHCGHGPHHLRMLPPLPVFREDDWPRVFACIERGLARVERD
jgi:4-aminobutyrate aminotransferase-like enzyme